MKHYARHKGEQRLVHASVGKKGTPSATLNSEEIKPTASAIGTSQIVNY